jgi:molecular chaperone DnaK (HSP70)
MGAAIKGKFTIRIRGKIFGKTPSKAVNPDEAVAMGATIQGKLTIRIRARGNLSGRRPARLSIEMRLWPWARGKGIFGKTLS